LARGGRRRQARLDERATAAVASTGDLPARRVRRRRVLATVRRVTAGRLAEDLPGLARPRRDPPSPAVNGFEDLVGLVLERLDGAVDLVAQSMGGVVALRAALAQPARVRRLVLVATSGGIDTRPFGAADWRPHYAREFPHARPWIVESRPDLTADLPSIEAPVLLIWGDADPISPVGVGAYLERALPRARLVIVPGGDHALGRDRAAAIAPEVARHLA
jgi:pimeloyl-ACP methyl ester carboxylesterase